MTKPILLIDADMLVYTMGYATEQNLSFIDGVQHKMGDLSSSKGLIERTCRSYCTLLGVKDYQLVITGKGNWRTSFYPEYKQNRAILTKPVCYTEIREWLRSDPHCIEIHGEEADDYLAAYASEHPEAIIVSADKDFFTVPGRYYHITSKRLFHQSETQALCFLLFQGLAGDRVDGYYGVRWLGKAKTMRMLKACHGMTIRAAYLFLKRQVLKRGGKEAWANFRLCLDLAALRLAGETGQRGIGLLRVYNLRKRKFRYVLPYYDVSHNQKYGKEIPRC